MSQLQGSTSGSPRHGSWHVPEPPGAFETTAVPVVLAEAVVPGLPEHAATTPVDVSGSESPPGEGWAAGRSSELAGPSERWRSEAVLERGLWREQPPEAGAARGAPAALEREPAPSLRHRITRAVTVPVLAGAVVLVVAVLIAIAVAALQPGGAGVDLASADTGTELRDGAAAGGAAGNGGAVDGGESSKPVGGAGAGAGTGPGGGGETGSQRIFVHVVGEVARPGVIEVASGARVAEAIEAAGGASEAAALSAVNLARAVVDGEQIVVPNAQQVQDGAMPGALATGSGGAAGVGGAARDGGAPAVVDLNTADAGALETLPRVGPALAQRILDWRAANGRFASVDQLLEVPGIGAKILDGMRERVRV
ncbi:MULTISPECIES: ComEA family DNA-binding protein [unclassified Leucobacter]|uniref:ComEA family DNA-binding protein n=1 Tax=unclassified Leucobacter TaxID=2621730 RepID=UPI00301B428C